MLPDNSSIFIQTYYKVSDENLNSFKRLTNDLIESTRGEMGCIHFGFSFRSGEAYCIESYKNAQSVMSHISNVDDLIDRLSKISTLISKDIHTSASQLDQLKEFIMDKNTNYFTIEGYFRNT